MARTISNLSILPDDLGQNFLRAPQPPLTTEHTYTGTSGNDTFDGTSGNDTFNLSQGGEDTANGHYGDDTFNMGGAMDSGDTLNGGPGTDTLNLNGDYSAGVALSGVTGVERIVLAAGNIYDLTSGAVAAGTTLAVNAAALGSTDNLIFHAPSIAGNLYVTGGEGADTIYAGNGDDTLMGARGNDVFVMGAHLTSADKIDGGAGSDTISLDGDYGGSVHVFGSGITNIENVDLMPGNNYELQFDPATDPAGHTLTVDGSGLLSSDASLLQGSYDGAIVFQGGAGIDQLFVSGKCAGALQFSGGAGNDAIGVDGNFLVSNQIDGGAGYDRLELTFTGGHALNFTATTITNIEEIDLINSVNYTIKLNSANVGSGGLWIAGVGLSGPNSANIDGSAVANGSLHLEGGVGDDVLVGGHKADILEGQLGQDTETGGPGADIFLYNFADESWGQDFDTITDFKHGTDKIELPFTVTGVNTTIVGGTLSKSGFDADLAGIVDSSHLGKHHCVLVRPDMGDYANDTFLVIDANGKAGYQGNHDIVILMSNDPTAVATTDFMKS